MLAVGIDISKSKSVAAILNQDGSMHTSPFEFHHTQPELDAFIKYILNSNQSATILMENTGHYHYPVLKAFQEAGLPVCIVNAYQIKKFGDMDLRKAKTDKKDAVRIARYALEKSYSLVPYTSMEQKYELTRPQNDPVYLFLLKKEQEGKPYNVAKMAGVNKFLRIYYARAMETLKQQ